MAAAWSPLEQALFEELRRRGGSALVADLLDAVAARLGEPGRDLQSPVMAAADAAAERGLLRIAARTRTEVRLVDPEGAREGLPERRALAFFPTGPGRGLPARELSERAAAAGVPVHEVIRWGTQRGWLRKSGGSVELTEAGERARGERAADERIVEALASAGALFLDQLPERGIDPADPAVALLLKRTGVLKAKERTERTLELSPSGQELAARGLEVRREVNQYGRAEIERWREVDFRPYDVALPAAAVHPAKSHPLQRIITEARTAFLELGFEEATSPMVESAFWDFDALFQPQDHPAREMQDTFYCAAPERARLPEPALVERVRRTHEDGGGTGSTGWGNRWDPRRAEQVVLRTHTTAATIRALAADPRPPRKVFTVGRVFRNETVSPTKLPEFTQVDGIIVDEQASLATLLGTLRLFYLKMGFERVRFKPAFFPYTEPSAEVYVWFDALGRWVEMGGSGVFRPEVTRPVGCDVPVLAWGLGLERLAMYRYGIADIRLLYQADLDWIREVPLCR